MLLKMPAVIAAIFVFVSLSAHGADTSGRLLGTGRDPAGNPVPGGAAALTNRASGVEQTTQSDGQGAFAIPVVPIGSYERVVSVAGFQPYRKADIAIDLGSALRVEVPLEIGGVKESVTMTEDAALVDTSDTKLGQVIGSKQLTGLPTSGTMVSMASASTFRTSSQATCRSITIRETGVRISIRRSSVQMFWELRQTHHGASSTGPEWTTTILPCTKSQNSRS